MSHHRNEHHFQGHTGDHTLHARFGNEPGCMPVSRFGPVELNVSIEPPPALLARAAFCNDAWAPPVERTRVNDYSSRRPVEDPYEDLRSASNECFRRGIESARPLYERAMRAADAIDSNAVTQDISNNFRKLEGLDMRAAELRRHGGSDRDWENLERQRSMLEEKQDSLRQLYLAPATTRANFGFALIRSGDDRMAQEGENLVREAVRLRPEIQDDPNFRAALERAHREFARKNGGAADEEEPGRDPLRRPPAATPRYPRESGGAHDETPGGPADAPAIPPGAPGGTPGRPTTPPRSGRDVPGGAHPPSGPAAPDAPSPWRPVTVPIPTVPGGGSDHGGSAGGAAPADKPPRTGSDGGAKDAPGGKSAGGSDAPGTEVPPSFVEKLARNPLVWMMMLLAGYKIAKVHDKWRLSKEAGGKAGEQTRKITDELSRDGADYTEDHLAFANQQAEDGTVEINGESVEVKAGDWVVANPDGTSEVVSKEDFEKRFRAADEPGYYRDMNAKWSDVKAARLEEPFEFVGADGKKVSAKAGDWIVLKDGALSVVEDSEFRLDYIKRPDYLPKTDTAEGAHRTPAELAAARASVETVGPGFAQADGSDFHTHLKFHVGDESYPLEFRGGFYYPEGQVPDSKSPVKVHVNVENAEKLREMQAVLIPALEKDPELKELVTGWKTLSPLMKDSAGIGKEQYAKGFTVYADNAHYAALISAKIDKILVDSGLALDKPLETGNVDGITGRSNRVGVVRDTFQRSSDSTLLDPLARLDSELQKRIEHDFALDYAKLHPEAPPIKAGERLPDAALRELEKATGLAPNTVRYDSTGALCLKTGPNAEDNYHGGVYVPEAGADRSFGHMTDRPAIYALFDKFHVDPVDSALTTEKAAADKATAQKAAADKAAAEKAAADKAAAEKAAADKAAAEKAAADKAAAEKAAADKAAAEKAAADKAAAEKAAADKAAAEKAAADKAAAEKAAADKTAAEKAAADKAAAEKAAADKAAAGKADDGVTASEGRDPSSGAGRRRSSGNGSDEAPVSVDPRAVVSTGGGDFVRTASGADAFKPGASSVGGEKRDASVTKETIDDLEKQILSQPDSEKSAQQKRDAVLALEMARDPANAEAVKAVRDAMGERERKGAEGIEGKGVGIAIVMVALAGWYATYKAQNTPGKAYTPAKVS